MVLGEIKTAESWARTYLLRPAVNPAEVTAVMVLTPQRGTSGLTNIWGNIVSVDSATKKIVASGDSLARQAASAEAAARRAAIDSAVRSLTAGRDSALADSLARVVPGAAPIPRPNPSAPAPAAPRDTATRAPRRDTVGARP